MPVVPARRLARRAAGRALALLALAPLAAAAGACAARTVQVGTGAELAPAQSIEFTNNFAQAVNVYLRAGTGSEVFVRQVPGRSTERLPIRGLRDGATVSLRVAPVDGAANVTRNDVRVAPGTAVRVP
jgi:hypothetical protein